MISNEAKSLSSKEHINHSYGVWKRSEELFKSLTGAVSSSTNENINHIDCFLNDKRVDVKGYKKSQENGFILVEFLNVQGKAGWCSIHSKADLIAFQFKDHFLLVDKLKLRKLALELCGKYTTANRTLQAKKDGYNKVKNKWIGRRGREDVFCYIELSNVLSISDRKIEIHN